MSMPGDWTSGREVFMWMNDPPVGACVHADRRRTRFTGRVILLSLVLELALLLGPAAAAGNPEGPPAKAQFSRLHRALMSWSLGNQLSADEVKAVFSLDANPRKSSETACIRNVEADVLRYLETRYPSILPTTTIWQAQMILGSMDWSGQETLGAVEYDRLKDRLTTYRRQAARRVKSLSREQVDRNTALTWVGLAEIFARRGSRGFYWNAEKALIEAIKVDQDLLPALYLYAWVGEKLHDPLDMIRPWRDLTTGNPDRPEYRLRWALNAAGAGRSGTALEELERVARSDGEMWVRLRAYEGWVQLVLEGSKNGPEGRAEAREILAEARREVPPSPGLDLLASYVDFETNRGNALRLAERAESHVWSEGEVSPQLRYEQPNPDEIAPALAELVVVLRRGQADLRTFLTLLTAEQALSTRSYRACD